MQEIFFLLTFFFSNVDIFGNCLCFPCWIVACQPFNNAYRVTESRMDKNNVNNLMMS
ncbi:hypothetical protein KP509_20G019000 [Ceratopteris richardii]|uniref:Uncharacterized protein n=1 Tax=Ceratopteris richardii TaxID=49495 RepID=A0A8T2SDJ8_CERRI|nr:hypothetical protein KP509_20G019000 [Ceratopteris richardii]